MTKKAGDTTDLEMFEISIDFFLKFRLLGMIGSATVLQALLAPHTYINKEEYHPIVRFDQKILEKGVDYKDFVVPLLLYSFVHVSRERNSHIHIQCIYFNYTYIKRYKTFTVNYPADVPFLHSVKTY